ncbi:MAG: hypothetical protein ACU0AZ_09215 [Paracoccaceae bacterium]
MPIKRSLAICITSLAVVSQGTAQTPLSAIDWLSEERREGLLPDTILLEPPVAGGVLSPEIQVTPLEELVPPLGLVPSTTTGLPVGLWRGSNPNTLARLLAEVPVQNSPAMQALLYTLLLTEARPPAGADSEEVLLLARLDRLMQLGATDPAQELVRLSGPAETRERFRHWFDATLLIGEEDRSCATLIATPHLAPDDRARIFCLIRRGDWQTAALLLETAHALSLFPQDQLNLLDRFLSPEIFEGAPPLPAPNAPDALTFRLHESIGEPLPTARLPRAFATADLRDLAGWKSQLEAAERLTRVGALNPNHLLGLYSERAPAASGGVWDRVAAIQRFETALKLDNGAAVSKALPEVWQAMQDVGLEVPFADLFADQLATVNLQGPVAQLAWKIRLLSRDYKSAALAGPAEGNLFLSALAQGAPLAGLANTAMETAIANGFEGGSAYPVEIDVLLMNGQLGEALLRSITLFAQGAQGNYQDLSDAIAILRGVGLEDTARRAALQLLLLERA